MLPSLNSIFARLRLKHFRLLTAIDDHKSLLKAAEHIAMSQPGATKALQEIEDALGETLFLRTNRGLEPNELGHCVIRYARLIQTDLAHLREEMTGILEGHGGRLSIGMIMGAVPLSVSMISKLLKKQPSLSVEIVEGTSGNLLHLLDDGRIDVAICRTSVSHRPEVYNSLNVRNEDLVVVASNQHVHAGAQEVAFHQLAACPWIACSANMPMRRYLEREFQEAGLNFPTSYVETTSAFATVALLAENPEMVALLATDVLEFWNDWGKISPLPVRFETRSEPYYLVTRRDRSLSPLARLFVEEFARNANGGMREAAE